MYENYNNENKRETDIDLKILWQIHDDKMNIAFTLVSRHFETVKGKLSVVYRVTI